MGRALCVPNNYYRGAVGKEVTIEEFGDSWTKWEVRGKYPSEFPE